MFQFPFSDEDIAEITFDLNLKTNQFPEDFQKVI